MKDCPICNTDGASFSRSPEGWYGTCRRCGFFGISFSATEQITEDERHMVSGWVRDQQRLGEEQPIVDDESLEMVRTLPLIPFSERPRRLLREALTGLEHANQEIKFGDPRFIAAIYGKVQGEVNSLVEMFDRQNLLERSPGGKWRITPEGHLHAEELVKTVSSSTQAFVAMWFKKSLTRTAYKEGIGPAIKDTGYSPFRIDRKEHTNRIDDEIMSEIRRSRFLVADFTGHRGGVYFEAGYALGLNLPVIWTCKKADLEDLHFDTRQYNFIDWKSAVDLRKRLRNRIGAVIGSGPLKR